LQEFSVPGAVLPFYSRGSQTPTNTASRIPRGDKQREERMEGRKENREELSSGARQEQPVTVYTAIEVHCPEATHTTG